MNKDFFELNDTLEAEKDAILTEQNMREDLIAIQKKLSNFRELMSTCCSAENVHMGDVNSDLTFMDAEACPECFEPCGFVMDEESQEASDRIDALLASNTLSESYYDVREAAIKELR